MYRPAANLVRQGIKFDPKQTLLTDEKRGDFEGRTRMSAAGLDSLVSSALEATSGGVRAVVVTTGHAPRALLQVVRGEDVGTLFLPNEAQAKL